MKTKFLSEMHVMKSLARRAQRWFAMCRINNTSCLWSNNYKPFILSLIMKTLVIFFVMIFNYSLNAQVKDTFFRTLIESTDTLNLPYSSVFSKKNFKEIEYKLIEQHFKIGAFGEPKALIIKDPKNEGTYRVVGKINIKNGFTFLLMNSSYKNCEYFGYWFVLVDTNFSIVGHKSLNSIAFGDDFPNFYISEDKFLYDFSRNQVINLNKPYQSSLWQYDWMKFCKEDE